MNTSCFLMKRQSLIKTFTSKRSKTKDRRLLVDERYDFQTNYTFIFEYLQFTKCLSTWKEGSQCVPYVRTAAFAALLVSSRYGVCDKNDTCQRPWAYYLNCPLAQSNLCSSLYMKLYIKFKWVNVRAGSPRLVVFLNFCVLIKWHIFCCRCCLLLLTITTKSKVERERGEAVSLYRCCCSTFRLYKV